MEPRPQKLPAGIQTFENLRKGGYVYVDKTRFLVHLIENGFAYFLSRPRRFGKSLTCSTLEALFQGRAELFKGLAAEEFLARPNFKPSPVIRLDMSTVTTYDGVDALLKSMTFNVRMVGERLGVAIDPNASPSDAFRQLVTGTAKLHDAKVVVLVDEYDKPYTDFFPDREKAEEVRRVMRGFYTQIKASDEHLRFVFLTGISKFTKMGVFSTINNLTDISIFPQYAEICGYTEEELETCFAPHLEALATSMKMPKSDLIEKIRNYYDGFSFDGTTRLYNPFSTLLLLQNQAFQNYWMESGTPQVIADYLKDRHLTVEQFRNLPYSRDSAFAPGEMDSAPPEGFLYQSGYLSLRQGIGDDFVLDYPNTEVLNSMSALVSRNFVGASLESQLRFDLITELRAGSTAEIPRVFDTILAGIPYDDYVAAANAAAFVRRNQMGPREWLYRSSLLSFVRGTGLSVDAEIHNRHGRADMVIRGYGKTLVVEIKIAATAGDAEAKLAEALTQIKERDYAAQFPGALTLAIVIDDEKRKIALWQ